MVNIKHSVHTKIWIEDENGETVLGAGQLEILNVINDKGSISAAARAMNMGYRSMWGKLKKIEKRIGKPLLIRKKGGASGGNSILTFEAKIMVDKFKQLQHEISKSAEKIFKEKSLF